MLIEVLLGIITLLILYYNVYKYLTHWRHTAKYPGPKAFPIMGNAFQIGLHPTKHIKSLSMWTREYNYEIYRLYFGSTPYFVCTNPKDVEVVLSSNTLLKKNDTYEFLEPWLGQGLLTATGKKWHQRRKIITPSFHFAILQDFLEIMNQGSIRLSNKLKTFAGKNEAFDVQELAHKSTFDIICETAMGIEMNSLDDPNSKIVQSYNDICYTMQNRFFSAPKRSDFLYYFYGESRVQKQAIKKVKEFTNQVIETRHNLLKEKVETKENSDIQEISMTKRKQAFLDTLLTATCDGKPLTNDEIAEEVSTFAFEGHDTTSSGISFAIFLLSRHPNIQEKVFAEQKKIFGNNTETDPTYGDIQEMKYLDMFIKEAQRVFPSVPMIGRQTESTFDINGKEIPNNSGVLVYILAMGFNEKYFPNPFKFDPERFNNEREITNPYEYVPFSAGPRNCIGQKYAMLEMKSIISRVVRNFEVLPSDDYLISKDNIVREVKYLFGDTTERHPHDPILASVLTLQSDNGVFIKLQKRNYN